MKTVTGDLELALIVKTADRLANIQSCIDDGLSDFLEIYINEHPVFQDAVYREGLCVDIWQKLQGLVGKNMTSINTSLSILIVADNSTVQRIIRNNLVDELKITHVKMAEDDSAALQIIQNEIVDIIIALQHRGDSQIISRLANHKHFDKENRTIPLIASVHQARSFIESALSAGADQCVIYPITASQLRETILAVTSGKKNNES